jgi:hypothetical protein
MHRRNSTIMLAGFAFGFGLHVQVSLAAPPPPCPPYPTMDTHSSTWDFSIGKLKDLLKALGLKINQEVTANPGAAALNMFVSRCIQITSSQEPDEWKEEKLRQASLDFLPYLPRQGASRWSGLLQLAAATTSENVPAALKAAENWKNRWFHPDTEGRNYHVIVESPRGEKAAQSTMYRYNTSYPGVYFELWKTVANEHYAVTVGTGLTYNEAQMLLREAIKNGMSNPKPFIWKPRS